MCNILVADDEYLEREVIKRIVGGISGACIVGEVHTGRTAVELCYALKPELVFINCHMGGVNGFEAAKQIRKLDKDIIIVMTTGYEESAMHRELRAININEYLLKPIRPSEIEEVVGKYIRAHPRPEAIPTGRGKKQPLSYYPAQIMSKEITTALKYIDKHFQENLSLEKMADQVYLSSYYFSRLFKKEVGVNFSSYLLHKKLDEAKRLLDETDKSILDVSAALNFKEQSYFCKVFKKNVGLTPTEYRSSTHRSKHERQKLAEQYI